MKPKKIIFTLIILSLANATILTQGVPIILFHTGQSGDVAEVIPIHSQQVTVLIDNGYVVTNVSQEFYNPHSEAIQGTYLFAIPEEAFISNFSLTLEGVKHYGAILPKEQAREEYQEAVEAGRTAALLEYVDRKMFTYDISIGPKEYIAVELVYEQFLRKRFNTYTYIHPLETKGYAPEVGSLIIDIEIRSQSAISNVHTEGYALSTIEQTASRIRLHYAQEFVTPETDLILTYDVADIPNEGTLFISNNGDFRYFMYAFAPIFKDGGVASLPKDVIFVLDKSGSMSGDPIDQTKEAMRNILPQLSPQDHFTIVFYDSIVRRYQDTLISADTKNIEDALAFINRLDAGGGTDINNALLVALEALPSTDRLQLIIFLTDGIPTVGETETSSIVNNIARANTRKSATIYAFGFGWDVNMNLLDQIATANHGEATRIHPAQNIEDQLFGFFQTISIPLLSDISIDYGGPVEETYPTEIPVLFNGTELIVVGKYKGENPMQITVTAESAQGQEIILGKFDITDPELMRSFVPKLWAIHRINYLLDQMLLEGEITRLIEEIKQLSTEFGLVTPYTSILIDPEEIQEEVSQEEVLDTDADSFMAAMPMTTTAGSSPTTVLTAPSVATQYLTTTTVQVPELGDQNSAPNAEAMRSPFGLEKSWNPIPLGIFLVVGLVSIFFTWKRLRNR